MQMELYYVIKMVDVYPGLPYPTHPDKAPRLVAGPMHSELAAEDWINGEVDKYSIVKQTIEVEVV